MATLLSLPREIRDQILRDAIYILRPLPASPSVSQDRIRLRNTFDPYWAHETKIYVERGLAGSAQMPLLWTNHQLRTETEELLKGLGVVSYRLDIMFVKECGILPTWLSFPNWRRHIDTVHAQVRIFNPPEGINSEWLKSAHFHGNGDGSIQTGWNIMFLLTVYLLNGFHDTTELYDGKATSDNEEAAYQSEENNIHIGTASGFHNKKIARYTIKAVILDVLEAPPTVHHATPGPADPPEGRQARRNAFGHSIFQLSDEQVSGHWPVPDGTGDLQVDPAHKLAFSLWRDITLGANMNFPYELYSQLLLECIGAIEIRINGVLSDKIDMTGELCSQFGTVFPSDPTWAEVPSKYSEWIERVVAKRKRDGLWNEGENERFRLLWA